MNGKTGETVLSKPTSGSRPFLRVSQLIHKPYTGTAGVPPARARINCYAQLRGAGVPPAHARINCYAQLRDCGRPARSCPHQRLCSVAGCGRDARGPNRNHFNTRFSFPVSTSHRTTEALPQPLAISRPSREKVNELTVRSCPLSVRFYFLDAISQITT